MKEKRKKAGKEKHQEDRSRAESGRNERKKKLR